MSSNDDEAMSNEMEVDQKMELMEVKDDDEGSDSDLDSFIVPDTQSDSNNDSSDDSGGHEDRISNRPVPMTVAMTPADMKIGSPIALPQ